MKLKSFCSACYAGLSCGIRVEIVNLLQEKKKLNVSDIAKCFEVTQPTISHHLQYLKDAGILKSKKEGRKVYYSVNPKCGSDCGVFI